MHELAPVSPFVALAYLVSGVLFILALRGLSSPSTSRRGTLYNVTSQRWINEQDNLGLRGQLLFKPSEDFSITLSGDYSRQNPECCGTTFVRVGRTQRPLNRQYDALAAAQNYVVPSRNPYDRLTDLDSNQLASLRKTLAAYGIGAVTV